MLPTIFDSTTVPILSEVVNFTSARHRVLAGNIANLHTPGYRTRDLSTEKFQERLKSSIEGRNERQEVISPGPFAREPGEALGGAKESLESILYHDDTNIGLEQQITEISENQSLHSLAISIMASQFRLLQAAVSERV